MRLGLFGLRGAPRGRGATCGRGATRGRGATWGRTPPRSRPPSARSRWQLTSPRLGQVPVGCHLPRRRAHVPQPRPPGRKRLPSRLAAAAVSTPGPQRRLPGLRRPRLPGLRPRRRRVCGRGGRRRHRRPLGSRLTGGRRALRRLNRTRRRRDQSRCRCQRGCADTCRSHRNWGRLRSWSALSRAGCALAGGGGGHRRTCSGAGGSDRIRRLTNPGGRRHDGRTSTLCGGNRPDANSLASHLREPRLQLLNALRCLVGLVAQGRGLARLREVQQDEDGQPDDCGEACISPDRADEVMHRECEGNGPHGLEA